MEPGRDAPFRLRPVTESVTALRVTVEVSRYRNHANFVLAVNRPLSLYIVAKSVFCILNGVKK